MSQFSEADIAKIINDCEILILPDNSSIEEVLANENQLLLNDSKTNQEKAKVKEVHEIPDESLLDETEDDFERMFQSSMFNKYSVSVRKSRNIFKNFYLRLISFRFLSRQILVTSFTRVQHQLIRNQILNELYKSIE